MNLVDLVLGVILLLGAIRGLVRGLIGELIGLASLVVGAILALLLAPAVAALLPPLLPAPAAYATAFGVIFIGTLVAARILGGLLTRLVKNTPLGPLNRILGGAVGVFKAGVLVLILLMIFQRLPGTAGVLEGSRLAPIGRSLGATAVTSLKRLPWPRRVAPERLPDGKTRESAPDSADLSRAVTGPGRNGQAA